MIFHLLAFYLLFWFDKVGLISNGSLMSEFYGSEFILMNILHSFVKLKIQFKSLVHLVIGLDCIHSDGGWSRRRRAERAEQYCFIIVSSILFFDIWSFIIVTAVISGKPTFSVLFWFTKMWRGSTFLCLTDTPNHQLWWLKVLCYTFLGPTELLILIPCSLQMLITGKK